MRQRGRGRWLASQTAVTRGFQSLEAAGFVVGTSCVPSQQTQSCWKPLWLMKDVAELEADPGIPTPCP